MPALSGSQTALMYSLSGVLRSGAGRSDYYTPNAAITIGGVDYRKHVIKGSVRITDVLDDNPNTMSLIVRGDATFIPVKGQEIIVGLGNITNRIFAGHVLNVEQARQKRNQRFPRYKLDCVDYSWQFDWKRVSAISYTNTSATTILGALISTFAPAFSTGSIQASLPAIDFQSNNEELLSTAVARIMKRIGGYYYIDYDRTVHCRTTAETGNLPTDLTSSNDDFWGFRTNDDISQVRTRTKVIGASSSTTAEVVVGSLTLPVDDTRFFSSSGGKALVGGNKITYTGRTLATGPGNLTGVTGITVAVAQGESVRVIRESTDSTAATAIAALVGTGDGIIEHVIEDGQAGDTAAGQLAAADVAVNKTPDQKVSFQSRDKNLRSGKTITVNLTNTATSQTTSGTFLIQQVVIDHIAVSAGGFPRRTVDAGVNRPDFFNIVQQLAGA